MHRELHASLNETLAVAIQFYYLAKLGPLKGGDADEDHILRVTDFYIPAICTMR